jgi:hypothetical protein
LIVDLAYIILALAAITITLGDKPSFPKIKAEYFPRIKNKGYHFD